MRIERVVEVPKRKPKLKNDSDNDEPNKDEFKSSSDEDDACL